MSLDLDTRHNPKVRAKAHAAVKAMEKAAEALHAYVMACNEAGETMREHGDTRKTLQRDLREFAGWLDNYLNEPTTGSAA